MSDEISSGLRQKLAQLRNEINITKREVIDKELRREMVGERKDQIIKLEQELIEVTEIEREDSEKKVLSELAAKFKLEIMKTASLCYTINYKELASSIGCKPTYILNIVDYLIASKELFATIKHPNIIFDRGSKKPLEASTDQEQDQEKTPPTCSKCNRETRFITQYSRYYCDQCKKYI